MKKFSQYFWCLCAIHQSVSIGIGLCFLSSCVNIESVNKFSTESVKAIQTNTQIDYSFGRSCHDFECQPVSVSLSSHVLPEIPECNCDTQYAADKVLLTLNSLLVEYLNSLAQLSDKKTVDYNYQGLVASIDTNAIKGRLKINDKQIKSAGKIATIITDDIMEVYRRKKVKTIIAKSKDDFAIVIDAYIACMRNNFKNGLLENDKYRLKSRYQTYLKDNEVSLTNEMKKKLFDEYIKRITQLTQYQSLCDKYIKGLQKIKEGYKELSDNLNEITKKEVQKRMLGYATDINGIYKEFQTNIKSNN